MSRQSYFTEQLNYFLQKKGVSVAALATSLGCLPSIVLSWTKGERYPDEKMMENVALYFGESKESFLETKKTMAEEEVVTPEPTATPAPVIEEGELPKPELLTGSTVTVTVNGQKYKAHKAFRNYLDELAELISMSYDEFQGNIKNFEAALQAYEDYIALNSELLSWKNINAQEYQGDAAYYLQTVVSVLTTFINALQ